MTKRFVYFYLMKSQPDRIRQTVPLHVEYWKSRHLQHYLGGPFADRTGGLISFDADSLDTAETLSTADPFVLHGLIESRWVKEWLAE